MRRTFPLRSGASAGDRYYIVAGTAWGRRSFSVGDGICSAGSAFPAGGTARLEETNCGGK